jgi:hypothetical protein
MLLFSLFSIEMINCLFVENILVARRLVMRLKS